MAEIAVERQIGSQCRPIQQVGGDSKTGNRRQFTHRFYIYGRLGFFGLLGYGSCFDRVCFGYRRSCRFFPLWHRDSQPVIVHFRTVEQRIVDCIYLTPVTTHFPFTVQVHIRYSPITGYRLLHGFRRFILAKADYLIGIDRLHGTNQVDMHFILKISTAIDIKGYTFLWDR